jgi:hypothetical protein
LQACSSPARPIRRPLLIAASLNHAKSVASLASETSAGDGPVTDPVIPAPALATASCRKGFDLLIQPLSFPRPFANRAACSGRCKALQADGDTFKSIEGKTNDEASAEGFEVCARVHG